jgi:hypothetical protein
MKKIFVGLFALSMSLSSFASFEPLSYGEISITKASNVLNIAPSISISFYGEQAQRVFKVLGSAQGATETSSGWAVIRQSADKSVGCSKSEGPDGKDYYNCVSGNPL